MSQFLLTLKVLPLSLSTEGSRRNNMSLSLPLRAAEVVSVNWDGYSVSGNGRGRDQDCNVVVLVLVVVVVASSSSFLRPADPSSPKARNSAKDSAKIPREAYREEDIVHDDEHNNGDD